MTERARRFKDTLYRSSQHEEYSDCAQERNRQGPKRDLRPGGRINPTGVRFEYDIQDAKSGLQLFAKTPDCVRGGGSGPFRTWRDRRWHDPVENALGSGHRLSRLPEGTPRLSTIPAETVENEEQTYRPSKQAHFCRLRDRRNRKDSS